MSKGRVSFMIHSPAKSRASIPRWRAIMKRYLPSYDTCVVCGDHKHNRAALGVRWYCEAGVVRTHLTAGIEQMGYPGVVHGGILCSLLDEALGWAACIERRCYFVSAELTVRFVNPAPTRQPLTVTARLKEKKSRYLISAGEVHSEAGEVFARASGKFFPMTRQASLEFDKQMAYQPGDWKFLVED